MKYKALLIGGNNTIIDDFFTQLDENFEAQTTSVRYEDIISHIKYFEPDIFIYCLSNEPRDVINRIISLKGHLSVHKIPLVIIGSESDCNEFILSAASSADLVLVKPITALQIREKLTNFIEERIRIEEEQKRIEEEKRLAAEAAQAKEQELNRRKHVLVIDDDPIMLKVIKELLREKYDVATAVSGRIGLKFLESKHTDLILLDYEMPIEDGPAVLAKIRANDKTKDIPVIFLTGITDKEKIKKVLVMKPQGYLLKPIDGEKLISIIDSTFTKLINGGGASNE